MELSIIVPCFNEADNLELLLAEFRRAIGGRRDIELLVVNNGSTDDTSLIMEGLLANPENAFARELVVPENKGYGYGILCGLRAGQGRFLAWTHADLQTHPADVLNAFARMQAAASPRRTLVRGIRRGRPLFDRVFTVGMGVVASWLLGSHLHDINAQPKLFHRDLLELMEEAPSDFSLDLYVLHVANQCGLDVQEVPVEFASRHRGKAKGGGSLRGKIRLMRRTMTYMLALRRSLRADSGKIIGEES